MNRPSRRPPETRVGQPQHSHRTRKRKKFLHRPLAVGALAQERRPLVVRQRSRNDLRGAGAPAVDKDHNRPVVFFSVGSEKFPLDFAVPTPCSDDQIAVGQKRVGDHNRRRKETARIPPQIENKSVNLAIELFERGEKIVPRGLRELINADITDPLVFFQRKNPLPAAVASVSGDNILLNQSSGERDRSCRVLLFFFRRFFRRLQKRFAANDRKRHLGPLVAAQFFGNLAQIKPGELDPVGRRDPVAEPQVGLISGRIVKRRDPQPRRFGPVRTENKNADPRQASLNLLLVLGLLVRRKIS